MFGHLPILEVDGKPLSQGSSIIRYLANEFNMAGEDNFQKAQADMILEILNEVFLKLPLFEKDEVKKVVSRFIWHCFYMPVGERWRLKLGLRYVTFPIPMKLKGLITVATNSRNKNKINVA